MIEIAHRANYKDNNLTENHPNNIAFLLSKGINCEIDVRLVNNVWYLGHDTPEYIIPENLLYNDKLWIHCKNLTALYRMLNIDKKLHFFYHENDNYTLTSSNYIWTYPNNDITDKSIIVVKNENEVEKIDKTCFGVCHDWIEI